MSKSKFDENANELPISIPENERGNVLKRAALNQVLSKLI
jgi:hypothetical protein